MESGLGRSAVYLGQNPLFFCGGYISRAHGFQAAPVLERMCLGVVLTRHGRCLSRLGCLGCAWLTGRVRVLFGPTGQKKARSNHPRPFRRCARPIGRLAGASQLTKTQRPPCASKSRRSSSKDDENKTGCARRSAASGRARRYCIWMFVLPRV